MHIVRTAAIITGVLPQIEELLEIQMPYLEVRSHGALALATLIHGDSSIVHHLQERHHSLTLAIGAMDAAAERADICPVVAESTTPLTEERVIRKRFEDVGEIIFHSGEEARAQLRMPGAGVEKGRTRTADAEGAEHVVELDRP